MTNVEAGRNTYRWLMVSNLICAVVNSCFLCLMLYHHRWLDAAVPAAAVSLSTIVAFGLGRIGLEQLKVADEYDKCIAILKLAELWCKTEVRDGKL